jgi:hypothetical protein
VNLGFRLAARKIVIWSPRLMWFDLDRTLALASSWGGHVDPFDLGEVGRPSTGLIYGVNLGFRLKAGASKISTLVATRRFCVWI